MIVTPQYLTSLTRLSPEETTPIIKKCANQLTHQITLLSHFTAQELRNSIRLECNLCALNGAVSGLPELVFFRSTARILQPIALPVR